MIEDVYNLDIDFIMVLDFEATCEHNKQIKPQEIIEFPLVVVDINKKQIIPNEWIQVYIKPIFHPILSPFCTELTGITQVMVDQGVSFPQAMKEIVKFLVERGYMNGQKFIFLTCGNWDLEYMLPEQAKLSRVKVHSCFRKWINVKHEYDKFYNQRSRGMVQMLNSLGLELVGRHHSGIDDCRNIANIVVKMLQNGWLETRKVKEKTTIKK